MLELIIFVKVYSLLFDAEIDQIYSPSKYDFIDLRVIFEKYGIFR